LCWSIGHQPLRHPLQQGSNGRRLPASACTTSMLPQQSSAIMAITMPIFVIPVLHYTHGANDRPGAGRRLSRDGDSNCKQKIPAILDFAEFWLPTICSQVTCFARKLITQNFLRSRSKQGSARETIERMLPHDMGAPHPNSNQAWK
jgi:hypothetical protein